MNAAAMNARRAADGFASAPPPASSTGDVALLIIRKLFQLAPAPAANPSNHREASADAIVAPRGRNPALAIARHRPYAALKNNFARPPNLPCSPSFDAGLQSSLSALK